MEIIVKRVFSTPATDTTGTGYTISHLYVDGKYICDTIEDVDRGLDQKLSEIENRKLKIQDKTAIPVGKYRIAMSVVSPRFSKQAFYQEYANGGRLPRIENVKAFSGCLLHKGNTSEHSSGCLILGFNKAKGKVINSAEAFKTLYPILYKAYKKGEQITLTITRTYKR